MIQRLSHVSIYVLDQNQALDFYVSKLGFEVRHDETLGGFRWLTVGPKGQPELQMILMPIAAGPMLDEKSAETLRGLVKRGCFCPGVLETADCRRTYEELQAKGVEVKGPPAERPYGIEALLRDNSGNWFSIIQPRR